MMSVASNIYGILNRAERKRALVVMVLMLIGVLFETFSIGLVIPALAMLTQQGSASGMGFLPSYVPHAPEVMQMQQMVQWGVLALTVVYIAKALFLSGLVWWQTRFAFLVQTRVSRQLLAAYLSKPYIFHLQNNSAQMIFNATMGVNLFAGSILHGLALITEIAVVSAITILLLCVEPFGTLVVVGSLGGIAGLLHQTTGQRNVRWGERYQFHEGMRIQHIQQGLGGVKDIILSGRASSFLARYSAHNLGAAKMARNQNVVQQMPRLVLEALAVVALSVLVLMMLAQGKPLSSIVPTIGLFATAAFRLMPSANRILLALQTIKYEKSAVETLRREIQGAAVNALSESMGSEVDRNVPPLRHSIAIEDLSFSYPDSEAAALAHIDLAIPKGTTVGFVGSSGSGKSTLLDVLLGLHKPNAGRVLLDGEDIQKNLSAWQRQIGYVPQTIYLTDESLRENVAFGVAVENIDDRAVQRALAAAQLAEFVSSLPAGLDTLVGERGVRLSGGQRQRIGIARALYNDAQILVLDEATSALDTDTEAEVMQAIQALHGQKTILMVAHRLSTVQQCDYIYRLEMGRVVAQGTPDMVL
jgi:ABC-type multidrug transport system fused ATPase/permease subunit